jgi:ABC-type nitrate/sulfonate/bicarbonate transport system ATPase subunit
MMNQTGSTIENPSPIAASLVSVSKGFVTREGRVEALRDVTMRVGAGESVSVVGPSGSGKSTLLGILAGLEEPDAGSVTLTLGDGGEVVTPRLGAAGYMPQRDLLLPWLTAIENATTGLETVGVSKAEARAHAGPLFSEFGLGGFANSYPHQLSGGMRQRVSFLRTALLARGMMLLDEPFGALDALTRASLQEWLLETSERIRATYVLVTHDIDEALLLSDRVYVLSPRPGSIVGTFEVDLPRPRSLATAAEPRFAALRGETLSILREAGSLTGGRR